MAVYCSLFLKPVIGTLTQSKQEIFVRSKFSHYMGAGGWDSYYGCGQSKSFVQGAEWCISFFL